MKKKEIRKMKKRQFQKSCSKPKIFFQYFFKTLFWAYLILGVGFNMLVLWTGNTVCFNPRWSETIISQRIYYTLVNWRTPFVFLCFIALLLMTIGIWHDFLRRRTILVSAIILVITVFILQFFDCRTIH